MAARIFNERGAFRSFSGWTDLLNTKQYTRTRVSRSLMQCLLKITRRDLAEYKASGYTGYARILGFKKERTDLLRAIKEQEMCIRDRWTFAGKTACLFLAGK